MHSLLFFSVIIFAQVGVNTLNPADGSILDVVSNDKGILIPRLSITNLSNIAPVTGGAPIGLMVFNTNTTTGEGFHYWNGSRWVSVASKNRIGNASQTATLVEPNAPIPGPLGPLTNAGTNNTAASIDSQTITRTINVTGFTGNIGQVTCNLQFNINWAQDADFYLQSPTGQIIELMTDLGGTGATNFNVTFTDAAAQNITAWTGGNVSGNYRPEGTLVADGIAPNITTMAGFNGNSPNGTWTLHIRDDEGLINLNFISFSLSIATAGTLNYRLVGEVNMNYKAYHKIMTSSTYSANSLDNEGVITAITRSTASAGAIGTSVATLPGTILSYASDSPRQGAGNFWVSTHNQALSSGLTDGTTYYFQLWAKGNIQSPATSNEIFSIIPMLISE